MTALRFAAKIALALVALAALWPPLLTSVPYDQQFRDHPNEPVSRQFPLGTDDLGRDRLSRLVHATRISLLAAPAAALLSTLLAALAGGVAGYFGGWCDRAVGSVIDLMLSLPWLFLLIVVRAMLPLNLPEPVSLVVTFGLIGALGWPSAARVVRAACRGLRHSEMALLAAAGGATPGRILLRQMLPNLRPVLAAKFWLSIPVYILAEANLSLLGLGVADPLPSWGNLLRELGSGWNSATAAWAPLVVIVIVVGSLNILRPAEETA
jgi:peptide/nickel transport system permease protein